jgi:hypothetical protein
MTTTEYMLDSDGTSVPFVAKTDLARRLIATRNKAIRNGMKTHTVEEIMDAFHDGRAGGEGLGRLWKEQ